MKLLYISEKESNFLWWLYISVVRSEDKDAESVCEWYASERIHSRIRVTDLIINIVCEEVK